jgi:hypothetical protein
MAANKLCPEETLYSTVLRTSSAEPLARMDALRSRAVQSVGTVAHTSDRSS